jgi:hypothetical protein
LEHISGSRDVWTNNNWRKDQTARGFYIPKYWIEQDFINPDKTYFLIEFSAPKFLYGENITALKETDLMPLVKKISEFCKKLGVFIFESQILKAVPVVLAVGKNINVTDFFSCEDAIETLSKFDYIPHAKHRITLFNDQKNAGREIIFSIAKTETFKIYSKNREIMNSAKTIKERQIAALLKSEKYKNDRVYINEILRVELTLKTGRKIEDRLRPYLGETKPTLENIFKPRVWEALIREEANAIYNHPLKNFIFLSLEQAPFVEAFLDKNYGHIATKDTITGIITNLQKKGIAQTRKDYLEKYASRQTWYNYLGRLKKLESHLDLRAISNLNSFQIHSFILQALGIESRQQGELGFNKSVSKKIDAKLRNTWERTKSFL